MKTVILDVSIRSNANAEFIRAMTTAKSEKAAKSARISFDTPELLWKVLTAKR